MGRVGVGAVPVPGLVWGLIRTSELLGLYGLFFISQNLDFYCGQIPLPFLLWHQLDSGAGYRLIYGAGTCKRQGSSMDMELVWGTAAACLVFRDPQWALALEGCSQGQYPWLWLSHHRCSNTTFTWPVSPSLPWRSPWCHGFMHAGDGACPLLLLSWTQNLYSRSSLLSPRMF